MAGKNSHNEHHMRLDKWLWAARFFKTRGMAQKHIELGRVLVNGAKVKNSKNIEPGDTIDLTLNSLPYKITVLALNHQRRPAPEARALYAEDSATAANSTRPVASAPPTPTAAPPNATAGSWTNSNAAGRNSIKGYLKIRLSLFR